MTDHTVDKDRQSLDQQQHDVYFSLQEDATTAGMAQPPTQVVVAANSPAHRHHNTHLPPPPKRLESRAPFTPSKKRAGLFGTTSNLVNTIVGAGIIGMPYAVRESGLVAGIVLIVLVGFLTDRSLNVLVSTAALHPRLKGLGVNTYEDCMYYPYGLWGRGFILLGMFFVAYGAMVAYFIIIKDTIPTIIGYDAEEGFQRETVLIVTSLVVILPLSMMRDMASLAVTSLISVACDIVLVFFVVLYSPVQESVSERGGFTQVLADGASINPNIFVGLGILSTAMCCQHSSFIIFGSLENNTRRRWAVVSAISISTATFLCLVLGVSGYLGFGDETQGDVLNNFPDGSTEANVARALLAVTMFFTYPMESFVGRHVLVDLIHNGEMDCPVSERQDRGEGSWLDRLLLNRRERMTLALYVLTLIPALIFDDLGPVLSITGAVGGSCLAYIGPGLVYLGVNGESFLELCGSLLGCKAGTGTAAIELPIAGDATSRMMTSQGDGSRESSAAGDQNAEARGGVGTDDAPKEVTYTPHSARKPIWWYLLGFPIWCSIAVRASEGMDKRLAAQRSLDKDDDDWEESSQLSTCVEDEELPPATKWDFVLAVFFIVFGVVALLAGLGTNLYVQFMQMND